MDVFYAVPNTSSSINLSPVIDVIDVSSPIIGTTTTLLNPSVTTVSKVNVLEPLYPVVTVTESTLVPTMTTLIGPSATYYYDTGVADSPIVQHETNEYLRLLFLDKELVNERQDILKMLKVENGTVKPTGEKESGTVGSTAEVEKKVDFIGNEILTKGKNMKILRKIIEKNYHIRIYDLPHNIDLVHNTQAKYVKQKIRELR